MEEKRPARETSVGHLVAVATVAAVSFAAAVWLTGCPTADAAYSDLYFPQLLDRHEGQYPDAPTAVPPTETSVPTVPTAAPTGTNTAGPSPTQSPPPTPTLPGAEVRYPTTPGTIVMQIGWTETDQPGEVWEEMNGTPYFTLYGDGRLVAGRKLLDRRHDLFDGHVDEYVIQSWLRRLTYDIKFFHMREEYEHHRGSKPVMHVYVCTTGGENWVRLRGFINWEEYEEPDEPDRFRVNMLTEFVRDIEEYSAGHLEEPYVAEWYTVLAQRTNPQMLPGKLPRWSGSVNVHAVAAAAPTAASNYVDKVVGHKFVSGDVGKQIDDFVTPISEAQWMFYNLAAEFSAGGRSHAAGARREVAGGSVFLPEEKRDFWYRSDPGSGRPPYLLTEPQPSLLPERLTNFIAARLSNW